MTKQSRARAFRAFEHSSAVPRLSEKRGARDAGDVPVPTASSVKEEQTRDGSYRSRRPIRHPARGVVACSMWPPVVDFSNHRFDATAYYTQFSNFIFKQLTGNTCGEDFASCVAGPGGEFTQVAFAQRDATFYGAEFGSQLDLARFGRGTLGVDGQYDYVHARFSDGTYVPRIPPQRVGGGVYFRDENWFTRVGLLHAFGHNQIAPNETPTGGYNLLKAEMSYTRKLIGFGGIPCEFTAGIVGDNLLNESVRNSVSFRKDVVQLPGRNVRLFANVRF